MSDDFAQDEPEDLTPLSVLAEILDDVVKQLDGVDDAIRLHRRACGDDHFELGRLQDASARLTMAGNATMQARKALRTPRP